MNNLWQIKEEDINKVTDDDILNKVLINRGIKSKADFKKFIDTNIEDLDDPYKLTDLKKAVKRLLRALKNNENILIYGDYDVDGITSTSLLINYFSDIGHQNFDYYIPNRLSEGYGLSIDSLANIDLKNYDLMITVDCGITAEKEVKYIKNVGLDLIITDHHKIGEEIPAAYAVIDPQREDFDDYKVLAGVGVVFKLLQACDQQLGKNKIYKHLDLVTLGTVADIVPLKYDNRIIVKNGLKMIKSSSKVGLNQLIEDLNLDDKEINPGKIGYIIAPPINAIGRMEEPDLAVQLLTTKDKKISKIISKKLISINRERQLREEKIFKQALEMIDQEDIKNQDTIILASRNWHKGVIGIVASRLVEKYYLPVILIAIDQQGIGHGSARSISGFDITEGLDSSKEFLDNYGGHSMAAGLTIKEEMIDKFIENFNSYLKNKLDPVDFIPGIEIDALIEINKVNHNFYKKLEQLKPFGIGNPRPKFLLSNIKLRNYYTVGNKGKHLSIKLQNGVSGICFNMGDMNSKIKGKTLDLAVKINKNEWKGNTEIQIRVEDINIRSDHRYYPLIFNKKPFIVYDKRGIRNKKKYILGLHKFQKSIAVYINGTNKIKHLKKQLNNNNINVLVNDFDRYKDNQEGIFLFNSSFDPALDNDTHIVLYSIPFSYHELDSFISKINNSPKYLHMIFNQNDLDLNHKLINKNLPEKVFLIKLFNTIKKYLKDEDINKDLKIFLSDELKSSVSKIEKSLTIIKELNLIKIDRNKVSIDSNKGLKLDLSKSVYYNNIIEVKKRYSKLERDLKDKNLFKLIKRLNNFKGENNEFK